MDFAPFRITHGDDEPSGENLEYDPAFISLELAAQTSEEQVFGDSVTPAQGPDHKEVVAQAKDVLSRSHDLRAAIFMAPSLLALEGMQGFVDCLGFIRWLLEEHWDTCHPQLDAEDDNDPTMRINAIIAISDLDNVLKPLRQTPLTESRNFGRFSLRDILIAEGEVAPPEGMDSPPDAQSVQAAFRDTNGEWMERLIQGVDAAEAHARAISAVFDDKTPGQGPDVDPLIKLMRLIKAKFAAYGVAGDGGEDEGGGDDGGDDGGAEGGAAGGGGGGGGGARAAGGGGGGGGGGAINTPQDVRNAIDRIIAYYQRAEPSSPVPLILGRARRLVGADFMAIIKDIAREGKSSVVNITGVDDDDDDD